ncbi:MAG: RNA polymerase sigma factor [Woeseiaceae bacterium]
MSLLNFITSTRKSSFSKQIKPHLQRLYTQAFRLTANQDDAEDLVQNLLLRLYEKKIDLETIEKLPNWLLRSLYHQFVDHYRKKNRLPIDDKNSQSEEIINSLAYEDESPHQLYENEFTRRQLQSVIEQLNPDQQALIALHDIEGHSLPELSQIMDLPLGTLKSRLHRARQTLRDHFFAHKIDLMEPFNENKRFIE